MSDENNSLDFDASKATIGDLLDRAIELYPGKRAYVMPDGDELTFAELGDRVDTAATALILLGIEQGDRVAIWMNNCEEWVTIYLGITRIGAVLVPVNTGFSVSEAEYVVRHSGAKLLVVRADDGSRDLVQAAEEVCAADDISAALTVVGEHSSQSASTWADVVARAAEGDRQEYQRRLSQVRAEDPVLLLYTSGSTGFPKGVVHSHKVVRNMIDAAQRLKVSSSDSLVLHLPFYHIFAAAAVITFLYAGGTIILMQRFDARTSLALVEKHRATIVYGINTMAYDQLSVLETEQFELSSIRYCMVAGAADLHERIDKAIGPSLNVYGMTETTSITSIPNLDDDPALRFGTVGYPLPGFEVKIVDESRESLPPGAVGELAVRGHPLMLGYFNAPEQTAAVVDDEGWFYTGDACQLTEEGYLKYFTRKNDMYRVGGENVDPVQVESVLLGHPAVLFCAVVGAPDERLGAVGVAHVQLKNGQEVSADELLEFAREKLARFKVPKRVVFVDEIPRTGSGKIQKFKLRE